MDKLITGILDALEKLIFNVIITVLGVGVLTVFTLALTGAI